jgi:hypothetical protein
MSPGAQRKKLVRNLVEATRRYDDGAALKVDDLVKIREAEGRTNKSLLDYVGIVGIWFNLEKKEAEERLKFVTETIGEDRLRKLTLYELAYLIDDRNSRI